MDKKLLYLRFKALVMQVSRYIFVFGVSTATDEMKALPRARSAVKGRAQSRNEVTGNADGIAVAVGKQGADLKMELCMQSAASPEQVRDIAMGSVTVSKMQAGGTTYGVTWGAGNLDDLLEMIAEPRTAGTEKGATYILQEAESSGAPKRAKVTPGGIDMSSVLKVMAAAKANGIDYGANNSTTELETEALPRVAGTVTHAGQAFITVTGNADGEVSGFAGAKMQLELQDVFVLQAEPQGLEDIKMESRTAFASVVNPGVKAMPKGCGVLVLESNDMALPETKAVERISMESNTRLVTKACAETVFVGFVYYDPVQTGTDVYIRSAASFGEKGW